MRRMALRPCSFLLLRMVLLCILRRVFCIRIGRTCPQGFRCRAFGEVFVVLPYIGEFGFEDIAAIDGQIPGGEDVALGGNLAYF